jgi:hypothetical protein
MGDQDKPVPKRPFFPSPTEAEKAADAWFAGWRAGTQGHAFEDVSGIFGTSRYMDQHPDSVKAGYLAGVSALRSAAAGAAMLDGTPFGDYLLMRYDLEHHFHSRNVIRRAFDKPTDAGSAPGG